MTSVLTDYIKTHRATSVYVQPCLQISEKISSHALSEQALQKIIENYNIKNTRYACIAIKTKDSKPKKYYSKVVNNSNYEIGDSN